MSTTKRIARRWLTGVVPLFVLIGAACGSDESPSGTGAETATAATTGTTGDVAGTEPATPDTVDVEAATTEPPSTGAPSTDAPPPVDSVPDSGVVAPPAARPDPCSLWTAADVQAVTGVAFGEGVFNESLSVGGQEICDWIFAADGIATAQVLLVAPALDYAALRAGTDESVGPAVDIDVVGASAAATSADGAILVMEVAGLVIQVAYLPTGVPDATSAAQLVQLAEIAASRV